MRTIMKNMLLTLFYVLFLVSMSAFGDGMLPMVPVSGGTSLNLGVFGGFRSASNSVLDVDTGFGLSDLGGGIGLVTSFVKILEIGADLRIGGANLAQLFSDKEDVKKFGGTRLEGDLMVRLMIPILGIFDIGGQISTGLGLGWSEFEKKHANTISPQWSIRGGPAIRFGLLGVISLYGSIQYSLANLRLSTETFTDINIVKELSNQHGLMIPIGVTVKLGDHLAFFGELETRLEDFNAKHAGFHELINMGVGITL
jgi:hypothetical protein